MVLQVKLCILSLQDCDLEKSVRFSVVLTVFSVLDYIKRKAHILLERGCSGRENQL